MDRATFTESQLNFLNRMRVARLATADDEGQPHVIPIVFATDGNNLYTPLDDKPKRVAPTQLKRVRNLTINPRVAVVVDEYHEDWAKLAWVLITGTAEIVHSGATHTRGLRLLEQKYPQYARMPLQHCSLIVITPLRVKSWEGGKGFA